jgi:hypothetical protein
MMSSGVNLGEHDRDPAERTSVIKTTAMMVSIQRPSLKIAINIKKPQLDPGLFYRPSSLPKLFGVHPAHGRFVVTIRTSTVLALRKQATEKFGQVSFEQSIVESSFAACALGVGEFCSPAVAGLST